MIVCRIIFWPFNLHFLRHLFGKQPVVFLFGGLQVSIAVGFGLQAFGGRTAAFLATCSVAKYEGKQEKACQEVGAFFHDAITGKKVMMVQTFKVLCCQKRLTRPIRHL